MLNLTAQYRGDLVTSGAIDGLASFDLTVTEVGQTYSVCGTVSGHSVDYPTNNGGC
jgi:hypothetical protein